MFVEWTNFFRNILFSLEYMLQGRKSFEVRSKLRSYKSCINIIVNLEISSYINKFFAVFYSLTQLTTYIFNWILQLLLIRSVRRKLKQKSFWTEKQVCNIKECPVRHACWIYEYLYIYIDSCVYTYVLYKCYGRN